MYFKSCDILLIFTLRLLLLTNWRKKNEHFNTLSSEKTDFHN